MIVRRLMTATLLAAVLGALAALASAQEPRSQATPTKKLMPPGSRVYVTPMKDGFETFIIAGIMKKKVPLVVVTSREKADYEISGIAESEREVRKSFVTLAIGG